MEIYGIAIFYKCLLLHLFTNKFAASYLFVLASYVYVFISFFSFEQHSHSCLFSVPLKYSCVVCERTQMALNSSARYWFIDKIVLRCDLGSEFCQARCSLNIDLGLVYRQGDKTVDFVVVVVVLVRVVVVVFKLNSIKRESFIFIQFLLLVRSKRDAYTYTIFSYNLTHSLVLLFCFWMTDTDTLVQGNNELGILLFYQ